MATGNEELTQESFPKHWRMGTVRMKQDKDAEEEGKARRDNMGRSTANTHKKSEEHSSRTDLLGYFQGEPNHNF